MSHKIDINNRLAKKEKSQNGMLSSEKRMHVSDVQQWIKATTTLIRAEWHWNWFFAVAN